MSILSDICKEEYAQIVMGRLEKTRALVISTTVCPACTKAKNILDRNEVEYREISLDLLNQNDSVEVGNCVYGNNPRRYVPYIYLDKKPLGGYAELFDLHQKGTLKAAEATIA